MGTNYYHRSKPCKECNRCGEEKHIGKSSCGWQFHFRGYRDDGINSYADWLKIFKETGAEIVDEYGDVISLADFKKLVKSKKGEMNHYNIVFNTPETDVELFHHKRYRNIIRDDDFKNRCWKDAEGHAFTDWEFK